MALYVLVVLVAIGLIMLHSIDASLGKVLGALQNVNDSIQMLLKD
jgi:hypothetical protein